MSGRPWITSTKGKNSKGKRLRVDNDWGTSNHNSHCVVSQCGFAEREEARTHE